MATGATINSPHGYVAKAAQWVKGMISFIAAQWVKGMMSFFTMVFTTVKCANGMIFSFYSGTVGKWYYFLFYRGTVA